jgi:hypothetical protein
MGIAKNQAGIFVPIREDRRTDSPADFAVVGAFLEHDLNGDESALIAFNVTGILTASIEIALSADGVNFDPFIFYPLIAAAGTIPVLSQPLFSEAFVAAAVGVRRVYAIATTGMRKMRVRFSAHTSGAAAVKITSSPNASIHPNVMLNKATTLMQSGLSAAGVALTLTLPAVAGLRHYIDFIQLNRIASAALVAGAGTTNISTTNLSGTIANQIVYGQNAAPQGDTLERKLDFGSTGLAALAIGTATTIVMPLTTNVIWHGVCAYRLGL